MCKLCYVHTTQYISITRKTSTNTRICIAKCYLVNQYVITYQCINNIIIVNYMTGVYQLFHNDVTYCELNGLIYLSCCTAYGKYHSSIHTGGKLYQCKCYEKYHIDKVHTWKILFQCNSSFDILLIYVVECTCTSYTTTVNGIITYFIISLC